jgi:hypothetical protein
MPGHRRRHTLVECGRHHTRRRAGLRDASCLSAHACNLGGIAKYPGQDRRKGLVVSGRERPTGLAFDEQLANGADPG